jgi:hypothetical protein
MNEKVDLAEREVERLDFVNLGDAAAETRQIGPAPYVPDSIYGWGYPVREPM